MNKVAVGTRIRIPRCSAQVRVRISHEVDVWTCKPVDQGMPAADAVPGTPRTSSVSSRRKLVMRRMMSKTMPLIKLSPM